MPIMLDLSILDQPFALSKAQISFYRENQYIKLRQVLPPEVLDHFRTIVAEKVRELNTQHLPLEARST
ncbi:MAG TPA: hypothetical protein PKA70_05115 [Saprospiraceae bacterium]|nr:hypothetical protein [Saprospiraceae bacterium]